jgi:hypothetical protein
LSIQKHRKWKKAKAEETEKDKGRRSHAGSQAGIVLENKGLGYK